MTCILRRCRSDFDKTAKGTLPFLALARGLSLALRLRHFA